MNHSPSETIDADSIAKALVTADEVWGRFLTPNIYRGRNQTLKDVMDIKRDRTLKYSHDSNDFIANINLLHEFDNDVVKLNMSNGAPFVKLIEGCDDDWLCLSKSHLHWLRKTKTTTEVNHTITEIWYNKRNKSVEVLLEALDTSKSPRICIFFASQYPYAEDEYSFYRQPL